MDRLKRSTKKNPTRSVKKIHTLKLSVYTSSSSSTSKTTSYTDGENEYDPRFEYDTWELDAIAVRSFFAERQARQKPNASSVSKLLLGEGLRCNPEDSISPRKDGLTSLQKFANSRQDSIIISRSKRETRPQSAPASRVKEDQRSAASRIKEQISPHEAQVNIQSFRLPSSPRKPSTEIHKFNLSSSEDESSDYELSTKRTFSDSSIVRPKQVPSIGRSQSHRFKKKNWHSSLRFTSLTIHSPRKRHNSVR